jgi:hypothetical protein
MRVVLVATALALLLTGCAKQPGGGGGPAEAESADLQWDLRNWDEANWQ